jgi:imidazolonepropionase-like amidohydrolase
VADLREAHDRTLKSFALAREAGVKVVMGTDSSGTLCPFGAHARELELFVEHGMSVDEALATATTTAASLIGRPDLGSLRAGAVGDAVIVDGNVLSDVSRLGQRSNIRHVVRAGRDLSAYLHATSEILDFHSEEGDTHSDRP